MMTSMTLKMLCLTVALSMMMIIIMSILMNFIHPLMMILLLVLYSVMNMMFLFITTGLSIYLYMIFISIIGGMMIMFLYFTSMINNHPSKIKMNELMMVMYLLIGMSMTMLITYLYYPEQANFYMNNKINLNKIFIYKIYTLPLSILSTITIVNLLYCLLLTIKVCSSKYCPLRKIN